MTNAEPSKKTYVVRGADRQTGESRIEAIDAIDEQEATVFASARGLLVATIAEHHPGEPIGDPKPKVEPDPKPARVARSRRSMKETLTRERIFPWTTRILAMQLIGLLFWLMSIFVFGDGKSIGGVVFGASLFVIGSVSIALGELGFTLGKLLERIAEAIEAKGAGK